MFPRQIVLWSTSTRKEDQYPNARTVVAFERHVLSM